MATLVVCYNTIAVDGHDQAVGGAQQLVKGLFGIARDGLQQRQIRELLAAQIVQQLRYDSEMRRKSHLALLRLSTSCGDDADLSVEVRRGAADDVCVVTVKRSTLSGHCQHGSAPDAQHFAA